MTCDEVRDLMAMCYTFCGPHLTGHHHISHQTAFPAQHTIPHFTTTRSHIIWRDVEYYAVEFGVMWNVLQCQMRDVPYSS